MDIRSAPDYRWNKKFSRKLENLVDLTAFLSKEIEQSGRIVKFRDNIPRVRGCEKARNKFAESPAYSLIS